MITIIDPLNILTDKGIFEANYIFTIIKGEKSRIRTYKKLFTKELDIAPTPHLYKNEKVSKIVIEIIKKIGTDRVC